MSKFNTKSVGTKTVNLAGGEAYQESPKLELISILLTSFVKDQFYKSEAKGLADLKKLISNIPDKKFVAQAAVYARTKFGMRSISHVVAGELAKQVKGEPWIKNFYNKVVFRVDDITEILAYHLNSKSAKMTHAMEKGLASAFNRFDEYQLSKYRGEGNAVTLVDAVNLLHPVPQDKNAEALRKLMKGELKSVDTWESKLTKAGQEAKDDDEKESMKAEAWESLLTEKKLGYFALLKNLRNIIEQAPDMVGLACSQLLDEDAIKRSLVLPFRFLTAAEEISKINATGSRQVIIALSKALEISLANVPQLDGRTLVVLDTSGSMEGRTGEIGSVFAAALIKTNDIDFMRFSDDARYTTVNPMDSLITIAKSISFISGGTNFHSIFHEANKPYDRIIILSDMQGWVGYDTPAKAFADYKKRTGANPLIYSIDLAGNGTLQFPERNIYALAGFSDKIFDIMKLLEQDREALIHEIESVEL